MFPFTCPSRRFHPTLPPSSPISDRAIHSVCQCRGVLRAQGAVTEGLRGSRHRRLRNYLVVHGSHGADKSYFNADSCNQRPLSYCSVPSLHLSREHIAVF